MFRFPIRRLVLATFKNHEGVTLADTCGLAISRWMDELSRWWDAHHARAFDRETRNDDPWDCGVHDLVSEQ